MPRKYNLKRRAESQEETRRRILDATVELHQTVGAARATISAIAERAGVERLTVLSSYHPHSTRIADTGTMRESICPSNGNLRSYLEAGDLVPCLKSAHTFPTIFVGS